MHYGITISYSEPKSTDLPYSIPKIYEWLEKNATSFVGIMHSGSRGNHPHHHILTAFKKYKRTSDLRRAIVDTRLLPSVTRYNLVIECVQPVKFGGYLFHENPHSIVRVHPNPVPYDLSTLREIGKKQSLINKAIDLAKTYSYCSSNTVPFLLYQNPQAWELVTQSIGNFGAIWDKSSFIRALLSLDFNPTRVLRDYEQICDVTHTLFNYRTNSSIHERA